MDPGRLLARHLFKERGHHRLTVDPASNNASAIRAYEKVGFRPVRIMRGSERGLRRLARRVHLRERWINAT